MDFKRSDASKQQAPAALGAQQREETIPTQQAGLKIRNHRYRKTQIETATPPQLVLMLYEGAIRFCDRAFEAMKVQDLEAQNENLIKVQNILGELLAALNQEAGGELAVNLRRIYLYLIEQLVLANLYDKQDTVVHVRDMLQSLRDAWAEASQKLLQQTEEQSTNRTETGLRLGEQHV